MRRAKARSSCAAPGDAGFFGGLAAGVAIALLVALLGVARGRAGW